MNDFLRVAIKNFETYKSLADKAIAQLEEKDLFFRFDENANSIAQIIQHMAGNARSRFTDFFTTDGEKPDRNRDSEFEYHTYSKAELLEIWENGWNIVFDLLYMMKEDDLSRTVVIRSQNHSALEAINRQVAHYAYHSGQIVMIAKHLRGKNWNSLSIPKGKSDEYNKGLMK